MTERRFGGERSHAIAGVFVFLLLGVFAVFSTLLVLFGAQAYRATTERTDAHGEDRMLYAFVLNSIRGDDERGVVGLRNEDGIDMLTVFYNYDGEPYEKRIYCYGGYLRELLVPAGYEFDPESGEEVCPAQSFLPQMSGGLLAIEIVDGQGNMHRVDTVLRTMT